MRSHLSQRQSNVPCGPVTWLFAAVLVSAAAVGCGGGSSNNSSNDGGSGGKTGNGGAGGGSSGSGGRVTTDGGAGGAPAASSALGTPCALNADCATGLTCVPASDKTIYGMGGPAHGYCTLPCTDTTSATACTTAGGTCVDMGDGMTPLGYCMQACQEGGGATAMKCNGRPDVACIPLTDNAGNAAAPACLPICSQDSDCPTGRKCDDAAGICVDTPSMGLPFGSHCAYDPTHKMDPCAGVCLPAAGTDTAPTATFCTKGCVSGYLEECGHVAMGVSLATGGPHGVCIPLAAMPGRGDYGACLQLCDTPADCTNQSDPNLTCDKSAMDSIGHGVCVWGTPATDGGVDGAAGQ